MNESLPNTLNEAKRQYISPNHLQRDSYDQLKTLIGSPLTPIANIPLSTPHEPSQQRSLIDYFESTSTFDKDNEAEYYVSDRNGPSCVLEDEFIHCEKSLDEIKGSETAQFQSHQKLYFSMIQPQIH